MEKKNTVKKQTKIMKSTENETKKSENEFSRMSKSETLVESSTIETFVLTKKVAFEDVQEIPQQHAEQLRMENNSRQDTVADLSSRANFRSMEDVDVESVVMDEECRNGSDIATSTAGEDFSETGRCSGVFVSKIPIPKISTNTNAIRNHDSDTAKSTTGEDFGENEHIFGVFNSRIPIFRKRNKTNPEGSGLDNEIGSQTASDWLQNPSTSLNDSTDGHVPVERSFPIKEENEKMKNSANFENDSFSSHNNTPLSTYTRCNRYSMDSKNLSNDQSTDIWAPSPNTENDIKCVPNFQSEKINYTEVKPSCDKEIDNAKTNYKVIKTKAKVTFAPPEDKSKRDKFDNNSLENSARDLVKYFESLNSTSCKKNNNKNMISSPNKAKKLESESKSCKNETSSTVSRENNTMFGSKKFLSTVKGELEYQAISRKRRRRGTPEPEDEFTGIVCSFLNNISDFCEAHGYADNNSERNASQSTNISEKETFVQNDTEGKLNNPPRSMIPYFRPSESTPRPTAIRNRRGIIEETSTLPYTRRNYTTLNPPETFSNDSRLNAKDKVGVPPALDRYNVTIRGNYTIPEETQFNTETKILIGILSLVAIVALTWMAPSVMKHLLKRFHK